MPAPRPSAPSWEAVRDRLAVGAAPVDNGDEQAAELLLEARGYTLPSPRLPPLAAATAYARESFPPGRPFDEAAVDLIGRIHRDFRYVSGATTVGSTVADLLASGEGVCQDFAHLAVCGLRSMGLAARYVSGYLETTPPPGRERLVGADASHAWASVFIGTGWLDVDPTNDRVADTSYVEVARGRDYADVPPLKGVIFSDSTESVMRVAVDIVRADGRVGSRHALVQLPDLPAPGVLRELQLPQLRHRARLLTDRTGPWSRRPTRCANATLADCNWVPDGGPLCGCCALTRTRPADTDPAGLAAFARTEAAKRRLVFQLDELGLPTDGVVFDLLSSAEQPVTTGHADGVVTIDLAEGDDPHREALRVQLAEPYRTLLGHLRHEIGHWYWTVLVQDDPEPFRALFGDDRADYAAALERHYGGSPPAGWEETAVSTYATAHPWEDWAETFAHYLHIRDTLDTAAAFGLVVHGPAAVDEDSLAADPDREPEELRRDHRHLAAADLRAERGEPVHGQGRPLPLLPLDDGPGQAPLRPRDDHRWSVR